MPESPPLKAFRNPPPASAPPPPELRNRQRSSLFRRGALLPQGRREDRPRSRRHLPVVNKFAWVRHVRGVNNRLVCLLVHLLRVLLHSQHQIGTISNSSQNAKSNDFELRSSNYSFFLHTKNSLPESSQWRRSSCTWSHHRRHRRQFVTMRTGGISQVKKWKRHRRSPPRGSWRS